MDANTPMTLKEKVYATVAELSRLTGAPPPARRIARHIECHPALVDRCLRELSDMGAVIRLYPDSESHPVNYTDVEFVARMRTKGSLLWRAWDTGELPGDKWEDGLAGAADLSWSTADETVYLYRKALASCARRQAQKRRP